MSTPNTTTTLADARPEPSPTGDRPHTPRARDPRAGNWTWEQLLDAVRQSGGYETVKDAESVTRVALSALGGHVTGDERVDLARRLPERAARLVASQIPVTSPLVAADFVDYVAARTEGATPATARWDLSSVLSVLPEAVGDDLVDRILAQLPQGYALLFGRPQLVQAA
ncbi:DUF2267 domain-containing protein [Streptomyces sp. NPDC008313]|uniref:DUF2267 domain-containing protein n=1 Tax=Streptomyces sp. NPDC008313 TaxID=3364826 RepID=UPI0036E8414C